MFQLAFDLCFYLQEIKLMLNYLIFIPFGNQILLFSLFLFLHFTQIFHIVDVDLTISSAVLQMDDIEKLKAGQRCVVFTTVHSWRVVWVLDDACEMNCFLIYTVLLRDSIFQITQRNAVKCILTCNQQNKMSASVSVYKYVQMSMHHLHHIETFLICYNIFKLEITGKC